jgi:hypothetical protein
LYGAWLVWKISLSPPNDQYASALSAPNVLQVALVGQREVARVRLVGDRGDRRFGHLWRAAARGNRGQKDEREPHGRVQ